MAVVVATTCAAIIAIFSFGWWSSHQKRGERESPLIRRDVEVDLPEYSPLRSEQEVAALNEEEVRLA